MMGLKKQRGLYVQDAEEVQYHLRFMKLYVMLNLQQLHLMEVMEPLAVEAEAVLY